ncbi:MAG: hypothetical protein L6Q99_13095 [Planctomycetes bacterium]|nr:hypothetical protein [Planctomycetota bacterium]
MAFRPTFCPFPDCSSHGERTFHFRRRGWFERRCDRRRVARFLCTVCGRGFSTQRFRFDYRLKRPDLLVPFLADRLADVGHRESARLRGSSRTTQTRHARRLAGLIAAFGARALDVVRSMNRARSDSVIRDPAIVVAAPAAAPGLAPLLAPAAAGRPAGARGHDAVAQDPRHAREDPRFATPHGARRVRRTAAALQSVTPSPTRVRSRRSQIVSSASSASTASR